MKAISLWGIGFKSCGLAYVFVAGTIFCGSSAQADPASTYSLNTTSTWREYGQHFPSLRFCKDRWAWICSLALRSKQPVKLTYLVLRWVGDRLDSLSASLYQKKEFEEAVVPIEKNLISEGNWDPQAQSMSFVLNEKIIAVNKYHLFISFSKTMEEKLRSGKFIVSQVTSFPCILMAKK